MLAWTEKEVVMAWKLIEGTLDYCNGELYATYKRTERGFGVYWVHPISVPKTKRRLSNALSVGGLSQ